MHGTLFRSFRVLAKLGKTAKRAKGGHTGGTRPFGYDATGKGRDAILTPRAGEHEIIPEIIERAKTGSLRTVSAWLASKGIELSHQGVATLLRREAAR